MLARADTCFEFGPLRLVPSRRALYADGRPVAIHGRALDLLAVLVEHRDRVVGRDELLARVWAGSTVSDNNIAVQVAALRRVLSAHGVDPQAIVNVSGRGYQFVAATSEQRALAEIQSVVEPEPMLREPPAIPGDPARRPARYRADALLAAVSLAVIGLAWFATWHVGAGAGSRDNLRLTIGVRPLEAIGPGATPALATAYSSALRTNPRHFGDFRVYEAGGVGHEHPTRYVLSGTLQVLGPTALLSYTLVSTDGEVIHGGSDVVSSSPSRTDLLREAASIFQDVAPDLFRAEQARRRGAPHDALDYVVEAQVAAAENDGRENFDRAITLAEQAVAIDPTILPGRLLLACLLVDRLSLRPAQDGDEDVRRAMALLRSVLIEHPGNPAALQIEAVGLEELGEPERARIVAARALLFDPGSSSLMAILLFADGEAARFADGEAIVASGQVSPDSAIVAQFEFAEGHDTSALVGLDRYLSVESVDLEAHLMTLMKVASLVRLDRSGDATKLIGATLAELPPEFRRFSALRRAFYGLPEPAWNAFKIALERVGMPP